MEKRPQDKSGILSEVSRFAATMPLHRNAENVDPIYNLAARLILIALEANQINRDALHDQGLGRATRSRICRIVREQENSCPLATQAPLVVGRSIFLVRAVQSRTQPRT